MKSVLISIQPKWCELIANGKKTVEVRKTRPKIDTPFKCYIYCTKGNVHDALIIGGNAKLIHCIDYAKALPVGGYIGNGNVIGEFVCDFITNYEAELWDDETYERIQEFYEPDDFAEYGEYEYKTIADNSDDFWKEQHLCKVSCLSIEELRKYIGLGINKFYGWHISNLVIYDKPRELREFKTLCTDFYDGKHCDECEYFIDGRGYEYDESDCGCDGLKPLKRPPQSWCYVERSDNNG